MYNSKYYQSLKKPKITPSPRFFQIIWIILYILMFISLYIVIIKPVSAYRTTGILFFFLQFILNIIWAPIFFIYKNMKLALLVCILLTIFIGITLYLFSKISIIAAFLLIPYFVWSMFACYLIFSIIELNKN
ncbi:tryptophan-rich sensory protein [bacterium]|nr:tryptophan-rich sensory protein [bacterium]